MAIQNDGKTLYKRVATVRAEVDRLNMDHKLDIPIGSTVQLSSPLEVPMLDQFGQLRIACNKRLTRKAEFRVVGSYNNFIFAYKTNGADQGMTFYIPRTDLTVLALPPKR